MAEAPEADSNDGAIDPRALEPFAVLDPEASLLIRGPSLTEIEDDATSYDDALDGGAGADEISGGFGSDMLFGGSAGDVISGDEGDDVLYGGAGRDTIYLGAGSDVAQGGASADRFVFRAEDLDGSIDRILDLTHAGGEPDRIDLRQLDLLDGTSQADWIAENVAQEANGDIAIDLSGSVLILGVREGSAVFQQEVVDALLF